MLKLLFLLLLFPVNFYSINVAVASNFITPCIILGENFKNNFNFDIFISHDSSGALYNKIVNKAPFDIYISADNKFPLLLENNELKSLIYVYGNLFFLGNLYIYKNILRFLDKKPLIISNKFLSPYGNSSYEVIENLHLNIIEKFNCLNINHVYNIIINNEKSFGFLPSSIIFFIEKKNLYYFSVPKYLHSKIEQRFIPLTSFHNLEIKIFNVYFCSNYTKNILKNYGYIVLW